MSLGITLEINNDGSISLFDRTRITREKGASLIDVPKDYVVIDIETTGLDPLFDAIIEVGALRVRDGNVVDKFESLIKPEGYLFTVNGIEYFNYISDFIVELTGITNEMLHDAPVLEDVLPQFTEFIKEDILVGHNVNFDINFLYDNLMESLDYKLSNDFVDLMRLSRKIYPYFENHKLITVATNLNIDCSNHHRALNDCVMVHGCFQKLSEYVSDNNIELKSLWSNSSSYDLRNIQTSNTEFNTDNPLYNKNCTFTGKLEKMNRKDAAQLVVDLGGKCLNSVTKQTNFLILGNFDYSSNIKDGKSSKLKKAENLILQGQELQILSENVFYDLINGN